MTAKQAITYLTEKGIQLSTDEVAALCKCAERVENPTGQGHLVHVGKPVRCGSVWLYPLTIGAAMWLDSASQMFDDDHPASAYLLPFALANSRAALLLDELTTYSEIQGAVKSFCKRLSATKEEIESAITQIIQPDLYAEIKKAQRTELQPNAKKSYDVEEIVALLCRWFKGTTPDYWTWGISHDRACYLLDIVVANEMADGNTPTPADPAAKAVYVFAMLKNEIASRHGVKL